jgi:hypothetical protein
MKTLTRRLINVFGYVRPYKPELKMREFTRYRACYCGLCKMIKEDYGEIPRYSTTYDLTFLTLTLLALDPVDYGQNLERCFFHAGQKTPVATPSDPLSYVAGLAVLLSYYKILDNIDDRDKPVQSRLAQTAYKSSYKKAKAAFPEEEAIIKNAMASRPIWRRNIKITRKTAYGIWPRSLSVNSCRTF